MNTVNYEYAINLQTNEVKWQERQEKLSQVFMYFTKNTILQFIAMDVQFRAYDLSEFIEKGDRGEFLASEIDSFLADFEITKKDYEESGVSAAFAQLAQKITNQSLNS